MEELREELNHMLQEKDISDVEVLQLSRQLDVLIKESYQLAL